MKQRVASKGLLPALSLAVWVSELELFLHPFPFLIELTLFFPTEVGELVIRYHTCMFRVQTSSPLSPHFRTAVGSAVSVHLI